MKKNSRGNNYELVPDDGKWLTQKDVEDINRVFSEKVYTADPNLWDEWTNAQKEQWENEHQIDD